MDLFNYEIPQIIDYILNFSFYIGLILLIIQFIKNRNKSKSSKHIKLFKTSLKECIIYTIIAILIAALFITGPSFNEITQEADPLASLLLGGMYVWGAMIFYIMISFFVIFAWFMYFLYLSLDLKEKSKKIWFLPILIYIIVIIILFILYFLLITN